MYIFKEFIRHKKLDLSNGGYVFGSLKSNTYIITQLKMATSSLAQLAAKEKACFFFEIKIDKKTNQVVINQSDRYEATNVSPNIVEKKINKEIRNKNINFIFVMRDLYSLVISSLAEIFERINTGENMALYNLYNHENLNKDYIKKNLLTNEEITNYGKFFFTLLSLVPSTLHNDHLFPRFNNYCSFVELLQKTHRISGFKLIDIDNLYGLVNHIFQTNLQKIHAKEQNYKENIKNIFLNNDFEDTSLIDKKTTDTIGINLDYLLQLETLSKTFLEKSFDYMKLPDVTDKKDS